MDNYEYSPQELKIIIDIANKHKIPVSIGDNSVTIHSKWDLKPLMVFSKNGFTMNSKVLKVLEYDENGLLSEYTLKGNLEQ